MNSVDYSKLPPDLQRKLQGWQKNNPASRQLKILEDVAAMLQEVGSTLESNQKDGKNIGALLVDIRESLRQLSKKEMPEMPDHAKPVVEALSKLEGAISSSLKELDIKPNVNVDAPEVNVAPNIDLKGVEKLLKTEIPKAFEKSIKLIPKTEIPENDYSPLVDKLEAMLEQLQSIDTASRLKPQFPNVMKVTGVGMIPKENFDYLEVANTSSTVDTLTYKKGGVAGQVVDTIVVTYANSSVEKLSSNITKMEWS